MKYNINLFEYCKNLNHINDETINKILDEFQFNNISDKYFIDFKKIKVGAGGFLINLVKHVYKYNSNSDAVIILEKNIQIINVCIVGATIYDYFVNKFNKSLINKPSWNELIYIQEKRLQRNKILQNKLLKNKIIEKKTLKNIKQKYNEENINKDLCPLCGIKLVYQECCKTCYNCGWSACG